MPISLQVPGVRVIGSTVNVPVSIAASLVTMDFNIKSSAIMVPMDLQAAYIMCPVDIQAQFLDLRIDIVAQTIGNIKMDIAAQTIGNIAVNIAASAITLNVNIASITGGVTFNIGTVTGTVNVNIAASAITVNVNISSQTANINVNIAAQAANVTISVAAQTVGVSIQGEWQVGQGNQKQIWAGGGPADTYDIDYNVPGGKALYVYSASFSIYASGSNDRDNFQIGDASIFIGGTEMIQFGGNGGQTYTFGSPIKITGGVQVRLRVRKHANHACLLYGSVDGYEVTV